MPVCTHAHPPTHTPIHPHLRALIEVLLNFKLFSRRQLQLLPQPQPELLIPISIPILVSILWLRLLLLFKVSSIAASPSSLSLSRTLLPTRFPFSGRHVF